MILELLFVTYIRIFFGHCHVVFPYEEKLSFFGQCHVTFHSMEPLHFFGSFVKIVKVSCFSDSFVQKRTQIQMAAVMLQVISSFYTNYWKNRLFNSAHTYWNYIMSKEYCVAFQDEEICFLPTCRYHNKEIRNIKVLLQKVEAFCFNYLHVDCLYTNFKYRLSGKIVVKGGKLFHNVQRAVLFNHQNRGVDRMPIIAKKSLLRKKYKKKHF